MFKWIFDNTYLENQSLLFYISLFVIVLMIIISIYLVHKELRK